MLAAENLSKHFGTIIAVDGVSLTVRAGEVVGLLGPNGAGKTTTLRMVAGILTPNAGRVLIDGLDMSTSPLEAKQRIGFLSGDTQLYQRLTAREMLEYFGRLYGVDEERLAGRVAQLIEELEMSSFAARPCGTLSSGQKQRANIARAFLHEPSLLVLDEPTASLDVVAVPVVECVFLLAPTIALVAAMRYSWRESLNLRSAAWNAWPAAVLLGLSAWTVGGGFLVRLLPPPESLVRALEKILLLDGKPMPLWAVWLVVAITPAVCEELLFRGLVLSALRGLGMWPALLVTSLLFGLAHASIYRLLPTFFLGLVFGYLVWKSGSVLTGIIAHALNNGLMATLVHYQPLGEYRNLGQSVFLPWDLIAVGSVVMICGLLLLRMRAQ